MQYRRALYTHLKGVVCGSDPSLVSMVCHMFLGASSGASLSERWRTAVVVEVGVVVGARSRRTLLDTLLSRLFLLLLTS